jgi:alanyl-tRNA synthetase
MRILIRELLTSQRLLGISDTGFIRSMTQAALECYPQTASASKKLWEYLALETERFERTVQIGMSDLELDLDKKRIFEKKDVLNMEKERGLPSSLIRYQIWQRLSETERINFTI